jgi:hypothetical protein
MRRLVRSLRQCQPFQQFCASSFQTSSGVAQWKDIGPSDVLFNLAVLANLCFKMPIPAEIIRGVIKAHPGHVFSIIGDKGFCEASSIFVAEPLELLRVCFDSYGHSSTTCAAGYDYLSVAFAMQREALQHYFNDHTHGEAIASLILPLINNANEYRDRVDFVSQWYARALAPLAAKDTVLLDAALKWVAASMGSRFRSGEDRGTALWVSTH